MTLEPSPPATETGRESRNLLMRIVAGAVLAPLTLVAAYVGGWLWDLLATVATIGMFAEWLVVVRAYRRRSVAAGVVILAMTGIMLMAGLIGPAVLIVIAGLVGLVLRAHVNRGWAALGLLYAAAALIASILVRADPHVGFLALVFVLLVVWVTDIGGYFAGRGIGGPKLWVRVSPKKTWAGAIGGFAGSLAVAAGFAATGAGRLGPLVAVGRSCQWYLNSAICLNRPSSVALASRIPATLFPAMAACSTGSTASSRPLSWRRRSA